MTSAAWVAFGALLVATVSGTAFLIIYSRRGPWWNPRPDDPHAEHRRYVGYSTLCLDLTFWVYLFRTALDPGVFAWVRAVLFSLVALSVAWSLWLLVHKPKRLRR